MEALPLGCKNGEPVWGGNRTASLPRRNLGGTYFWNARALRLKASAITS